MNLQQLTSGTPAAKPWLNIVAHDIVCRSITPIIPIPAGIPSEIRSADLSSSLTANDIGIGGGGLDLVGSQLDMNGALFRNPGLIDTAGASLNIITPTTAISQGSSDWRVSVDSIDRVIAASGTTRIYTQSAQSGPSGSSLVLNDDSTFVLGSYFSGNGALECIANDITLVGPQARSQVKLNLTSITNLLFNGAITVPREVLDASQHTFFDSTGVERLRVSNGGVRISNAYTLPSIAGASGDILTSDGLGLATWAAPVIPIASSIRSPDALTVIQCSNAGIATTSANAIQRVIVNPLGTTIQSQAAGHRVAVDELGGVQIDGLYRLPITAGAIGQVLTKDGVGGSVWQDPQIVGIFSSTGAPTTVSNTTIQTNIQPAGVGSFNIPANFLQPGMSYIVRAGGTFRDNANNTQFTLRLSSSVVLFSSGTLTLNNVPAIVPWQLSIQFTFTGGTQLINAFSFQYSDTSDGRGFTGQQLSNTINTAIANPLNLSVQWAVASANNILTTNWCTCTRAY
jgi:hypothetical protein